MWTQEKEFHWTHSPVYSRKSNGLCSKLHWINQTEMFSKPSSSSSTRKTIIQRWRRTRRHPSLMERTIHPHLISPASANRRTSSRDSSLIASAIAVTFSITIPRRQPVRYLGKLLLPGSSTCPVTELRWALSPGHHSFHFISPDTFRRLRPQLLSPIAMELPPQRPTVSSLPPISSGRITRSFPE